MKLSRFKNKFRILQVSLGTAFLLRTGILASLYGWSLKEQFIHHENLITFKAKELANQTQESALYRRGLVKIVVVDSACQLTRTSTNFSLLFMGKSKKWQLQSPQRREKVNSSQADRTFQYSLLFFHGRFRGKLEL